MHVQSGSLVPYHVLVYTAEFYALCVYYIQYGINFCIYQTMYFVLY